MYIRQSHRTIQALTGTLEYLNELQSPVRKRSTVAPPSGLSGSGEVVAKRNKFLLQISVSRKFLQTCKTCKTTHYICSRNMTIWIFRHNRALNNFFLQKNPLINAKTVFLSRIRAIFVAFRSFPLVKVHLLVKVRLRWKIDAPPVVNT